MVMTESVLMANHIAWGSVWLVARGFCYYTADYTAKYWRIGFNNTCRPSMGFRLTEEWGPEEEEE